MRTTDPGPNAALIFVAAVLGIILLALGVLIVLPLALAFIGWRVYLWYSRLPLKTEEVVQAADLGERVPFPSVNEFLESELNHLFDIWEEDLPHYCPSSGFLRQRAR